MARWMEIVGNKADDVSGQLGPKLSTRGRPEGRKPSGINQAARDLGIPATQLKRASRIASLSPEAKAAARDHGVETQAALLDAAKAKTPAAQVEVIERRAAKFARRYQASWHAVYCLNDLQRFYRNFSYSASQHLRNPTLAHYIGCERRVMETEMLRLFSKAPQKEHVMLHHQSDGKVDVVRTLTLPNGKKIRVMRKDALKRTLSSSPAGSTLASRKRQEPA